MSAGNSTALNPKNYTYFHTVQQARNPAEQPKAVNKPELIYATGSQTFYLLNQQEFAVFNAATQWFQPAIGKVMSMNALPNEDQNRFNQISTAKSQLNSILKSYVQGADENTLAEVVWFGKKKFVYMDQKKLEQFKKSYSVQDEANQKEVQNQDGSFSTKKLLSHLKIQDADLADYDKEHDGAMKGLAKALGVPSLDAGKVFFGNPKDPNSILVATADAQLMRYTAGLSAGAGFDPAAHAFSLDADASSQLTLGSAHVNVTCYAPSQQGWDVSFPLPTPKGNQPFDLGYFRGEFTLDLSAFAGASVMADATMSCNMNPNGKLEVNGTNGAKATVNAFAGAKAGCDVTCGFWWQNPEKGEGADGWDKLAEIGADGDVSAGMGVNGDFCIDYNQNTGKFLVYAAAGLTCGPGLDGSITVVVDAKHVASFIAFVYHKIMNANYVYTGAITDAAFKILIDLLTKAIFSPPAELGDFFIKEAKTIITWW